MRIPAKAVASWNVIEIAEGIYEIYNTFTATAGAVEHGLTINYPFELLAIYVQHTDAALALSVDALTWDFDRVKPSDFPQPFPLVAYTSSIISNFLELFRGQEFILPAGNYHLTENTTATDLVYVRLLIKVAD